jgi:hypothetical protein
MVTRAREREDQGLMSKQALHRDDVDLGSGEEERRAGTIWRD